MTKPSIYMDNAATAPLRPDVLAAMMPCLTENFGNPSGVHSRARDTQKAVGEARRQVGAALNAKPEEIFFTSGGTEGDNWAVKGAAEAYAQRAGQPGHIIASAIEHHAVLYACKHLEKQGWRVTYLPVDAEGFVTPEAVESALRSDTALVTVMLASNEIGAVEPLAEIGRVTRARKVPLHTDAVQACGHIPVDVETLGVDLLTLSAHKFGGPKGAGALFIRKGMRINPLLHGGAQESNRRAGTENVAGIAGLSRALTLSLEEMPKEAERQAALRDRLIDGLLAAVPHARLNGPRHNRLPGNVNLSFSFVEGESLLLMLDMQGVCASSGSACSSGSLDPSHVLTALGLTHEQAHGSVRFTLGRQNTIEEVETVIKILPPIVEKLRAMSPLYEDFLRKRKP